MIAIVIDESLNGWRSLMYLRLSSSSRLLQ